MVTPLVSSLDHSSINDWVMDIGEDPMGEGSRLIGHEIITNENESESDYNICCCDHLISCIDNSLEELACVASAVVRCWTRCIGFYTDAPVILDNRPEN